MAHELATVKEFGLLLALAAAEYEREQCCKDICRLCAEGHLVVNANGPGLRGTFRHFHDADAFTRTYGEICYASAIRERAYQEEFK